MSPNRIQTYILRPIALAVNANVHNARRISACHTGGDPSSYSQPIYRDRGDHPVGKASDVREEVLARHRVQVVVSRSRHNT